MSYSSSKLWGALKRFLLLRYKTKTGPHKDSCTRTHAMYTDTYTHPPLVCVHKKRLQPSRYRVQSCDLRGMIQTFSFSSILHRSCFNIRLGNVEGTQPIKCQSNTKEKHNGSQFEWGWVVSLNLHQEFEAVLDSLWIFPVHLYNALHTLGQFFHSHKVVLLLHGL